MPKITPLPHLVLLETQEQVDILRRILEDLRIVAFDTETTSLDIYSAEARLISFSFPRVPWRDTWGDHLKFYRQNTRPATHTGIRIVAENAELVEPILSLMEDIDVVAHNFKFDAHIIYRNFGYIPAKNGVAYDTVVLDHLYDENNVHDLKDCCRRYGLVDGMQPFNKLFKKPTKREIKDPFCPAYEGMPAVDWALITQRDLLLDYAGTDAYATWLLFEYLRDNLLQIPWFDEERQEGSNYFQYYLRFEEPYLKAVWQMELNGACLDIELLQHYEKELEAEIQKSKGEFFRALGRVINLNSHQQVAQALYSQPPVGLGLPVIAYTAGGKSGKKSPATDKSVLEELAKRSEPVAHLLRYNNLRKIHADYAVGLQHKVHPDGRIRSNFNIQGTVTGRLSSSGPNLQNIPSSETEIGRKFNIRAAFKASPGHKLVGADYSTLEIVITAQITKDANLINALLSGRDLHSYTAALMFDIPYEQVVEAKKAEAPSEQQKKLVEYRKYAKAVTFGVLYGAGEQRISQTIGCDLDKAAEVIEKFYSAYPGILEAKEYWTEFCRKHGYVKTLLGRYRRLPSIWSSDKGSRGRAERQLFNTLIQGTAADLMRTYMPRLVNDPRMRKIGAKLILQVHDEVVVEVPEPHAEECKELVEEILADALSWVDWVVPLAAEAKIGNNWAETK